MSDFYETQLLRLAAICVVSLLAENLISKRKRSPESRESGKHAGSSTTTTLMRQYLMVYAIVMAADWLQGPYVYSLYREQYNFSERLVAVLFVTGFMSAGLAAPLVGVWADQHLPQSDLSLILGRATLVNGFVAAGAGIFSNQLVSYTGSFASPFVASGALLVLAYMAIRGTWAENYGTAEGSEKHSESQSARLAQAWRIVKKDPLLIALGFTQTCFEGGMYLFVFLWVPSLQESAQSNEQLPLGYIFSAYMVSMMLGSLIYTIIVSHLSPPTEKALPTPPSTLPDAGDSSLTLHAKLSSTVCAISALALAASVSSQDEKIRFWAFCTFEACVGMYYPVQGMLRGTLIANEHRATLSALFRVPLNVFVVVSLLTGVSSARYAVLSATSLMLAVASVMTGLVVVKRADALQASPAGRHPLRG
ncbi:hypothetical protein V5O48_002755 [Marasmius crinis-equi]|uniref:Molybdate-anion transporter n=1 Tax=Marasmius crinis-equi TaxID=585013 RepID=A0ABR3FUT1_9AGAR